MLTFSVEKKSPWMAAERCGIKTRLIYMFCVLLWYICTVLCPDHVICMYCVLPWYNIGIVHCPGAYVLCLPWLWFVVVVPMYMYCVLPGYICIELCPVAYVLCVPWLCFFFFFSWFICILFCPDYVSNEVKPDSDVLSNPTGSLPSQVC